MDIVSSRSTKTGLTKEAAAYVLILVMMAVSFTGLSYFRYAIYATPVFATMIWVFYGGGRIRFKKDLVPFYLLLFMCLVTNWDFDQDAVKKTIFIAVYVYVFTLFDFSKIKIDVLKLGIFYVLLMLMRLFLDRKIGQGFDFSFSDSRSTFESTISFPLGLISLYYLITRKYIGSGVFALLSLLSLKRIVLAGLVFAFVCDHLPKMLKRLVLNPYTVLFAALLVLFLSIYFAYGGFDEVILEYTGYAANHLSKGRRELWYLLLTGVDYNFLGFVLIGEGNGAVVNVLQNAYSVDRILGHNDILMLYVEFGLLFLIAFVFTLNNHKSMSKRLFAMYLSLLFFTDNVIIYQHVMMTYLLLQSQLSRQVS